MAILQQGGLAALAGIALFWALKESKARDTDRAESQRTAALERDSYMRSIEKERAENSKLQADILRIAQETSAVNAINRQTLEELKMLLSTAKQSTLRRRSTT